MPLALWVGDKDEDRRAKGLKIPAGSTNAYSSQLYSEPTQAMCASGWGPQCWCQKHNQEWERHEAQTGIPAWSSPQATACVAPHQLPRILGSHLRRGGRGLSSGAGGPFQTRLKNPSTTSEAAQDTRLCPKEAGPKPQAKLPASQSPWPQNYTGPEWRESWVAVWFSKFPQGF